MARLPPLNAVRVFEAAARLGSFNHAAEELHVTPSAVSHQVRALEEYLGVKLFRRLTRQVRLTSEGRLYLGPVRDALEQIRLATEQIARDRYSGPLTISAAPSFTVGWLMPRLSEFQLAHPDIEVRLNASVELVDLTRSDVDVGIRSGSRAWPGLRAHRLMAEELVPVCSPRLLEPAGALGKPADLVGATLLHELPRMGQWRSWLSVAGVQHPDPDRGPKFQNQVLAVEAAVAGMGVALANRRFVESRLREGRLVVPFEADFASECVYYLVYPEARAEQPKIAAFRDWLLEAAAADGERLAEAAGATG